MRLIDCFSPVFGYVGHVMTGHGPYPALAEFQQTVERLFGRAEDTYGKGGFPAADFEDAKFAVAAWVDEQVLCSDWPEKDQWRGRQLQKVYFKTTNGGREFFERLMKMKDERKSVREVYLACLMLGFRGQYYGVRDIPELEVLSADQLGRVMRETVNPFASEELKFFPGAYLDARQHPKKQSKMGLIGVLLLASLMGMGVIAGLYGTYHGLLNNLLSEYFNK